MVNCQELKNYERHLSCSFWLEDGEDNAGGATNYLGLTCKGKHYNKQWDFGFTCRRRWTGGSGLAQREMEGGETDLTHQW